MAAFSSSSVSSGGRYDVFINFRREDTRKIFIGHLYKALVQKSIYTFIDGDDPELPTTIQESRLSIVVFSKNYASSTRCLKQLVHILDRVDTKKHIVVPIFYQIDPSDLRKLAGSFAKAFAQHDHDSNANIDEVQSWRSALTKASNFSGWASRDYRDDAKFIEGIVHDTFNQLLQFSKVYISFGGLDDTRKNFVAHLIKALHQNALSTFIDVSADNKGDHINSLFKVVQQSRISIVILSGFYATSSWCLTELVAILECADTNNQIVIPVFYGVEPSEVRLSTGRLEAAVVKLARDSRDNREKATLWRSSLTRAANYHGLVRNNFKDDAELIEAIVQRTWRACRDFERILN